MGREKKKKKKKKKLKIFIKKKKKNSLFSETIYSWPSLSINDINTSFEVIGTLTPNTKLKIINNTHLAAENGYAISINRYREGQSRNKIISFLNHLFLETKRNMYNILTDIRSDKDVDTNIDILFNMTYKLAIFIHQFDNMRSVYQTDSSIYAGLGNIKDNFITFRSTFQREIIIKK